MKKKTCRNCGRRRLVKFMIPFMATNHGVAVKDLYPLKSNSKQEWECGDCEENIKSIIKH